MDLPQIPLLAMLRERMAWLSQRQNVLSQNVANVDTPGYTARDLKPVDFGQMLENVGKPQDGASGLTVTNPRHIAITPQATSTFDDVESDDAEANPNGNSVSLESEMIKEADNQAQFQAAANLYTKAMNLMRTAIGHGGS
jgi:flagellar basal-body rod protein FlgB